MRKFALGYIVLSAAAGQAALAVPLYTENFDVNNTALWQFNSSVALDTAANNANNEANFFFDYSTAGIPSAPGSGGTTRGLKMEANIPDGTGTLMGGSASPLGLVLPSEYILTAHVWQNANGAAAAPGFPAGGTGSTQLTTMTVGTTGNANEFAGGTMTGVQGGATGEGGTTNDWRVYSGSMPDGAGAVISPSAHLGVYAAGNTAADLNNTDAYYGAMFAGQTPPATQTTLFAQQNGTTQTGTPAFLWNLWRIEKTLTETRWYVNGTLVATVPASLYPANFNTNPNIALGHADINAGLTDAAGRPMLFGLFDNVEVNPIPEPASLSLLALAGLTLPRLRRRNA